MMATCHWGASADAAPPHLLLTNKFAKFQCMKHVAVIQSISTDDGLRAFIQTCLKAIADCSRGLPRAEAAFTMSSYGIAVGLLDSEANVEREILELALDLEVPDEAFLGNPEQEWRKLTHLVHAAAIRHGIHIDVHDRF
jgi:hypothetical protein